jgi:septum formation protein
MSKPALLEICGLWRGAPIILASKSGGRARLLESAGIPFEAVDSEVDERRLEGIDVLEQHAQAASLALAKAQAVSFRRPDRVVVGADQTLAFHGKSLHKASSVDEALSQLRELRGAPHLLHSAVACARNGVSQFEFVVSATIHMRNVNDNVLAAYAAAMGAKLLTTVGGYEIEGFGATLIEQVDGDMFTVIGLPLFPLLAQFRKLGLIVEESEPR